MLRTDNTLTEKAFENSQSDVFKQFLCRIIQSYFVCNWLRRRTPWHNIMCSNTILPTMDTILKSNTTAATKYVPLSAGIPPVDRCLFRLCRLCDAILIFVLEVVLEVVLLTANNLFHLLALTFYSIYLISDSVNDLLTRLMQFFSFRDLFS